MRGQFTFYFPGLFLMTKELKLNIHLIFLDYFNTDSIGRILTCIAYDKQQFAQAEL